MIHLKSLGVKEINGLETIDFSKRCEYCAIATPAKPRKEVLPDQLLIGRNFPEGMVSLLASQDVTEEPFEFECLDYVSINKNIETFSKTFSYPEEVSVKNGLKVLSYCGGKLKVTVEKYQAWTKFFGKVTKRLYTLASWKLEVFDAHVKSLFEKNAEKVSVNPKSVTDFELKEKNFEITKSTLYNDLSKLRGDFRDRRSSDSLKLKIVDFTLIRDLIIDSQAVEGNYPALCEAEFLDAPLEFSGKFLLMQSGYRCKVKLICCDRTSALKIANLLMNFSFVYEEMYCGVTFFEPSKRGLVSSSVKMATMSGKTVMTFRNICFLVPRK